MIEWILWELLIETGKEKKTLFYSDTIKELEKRRIYLGTGRNAYKNLIKVLHNVCIYAYKNWKILPGSLLVSKKEKIPSHGYFKFLKELGVCENPDIKTWERERRRFYEFCSKL